MPNNISSSLTRTTNAMMAQNHDTLSIFGQETVFLPSLRRARSDFIKKKKKRKGEKTGYILLGSFLRLLALK